MNSSMADLATLGKLLEEHRSRLLAMIDRRLDPRLKARVGAEDILQDVFGIARTRWDTFLRAEQPTDGDRRRSVYSWLYGIALNALIDAWRKHNRRRRNVRRDMPFPDASSLQLGCGLLAPGTGPSQAAHREELQQMVQLAMNQLKDSDRDVLWMRYNDQLTFGEIADVLKIKENAATLRCCRALRRLKELWDHLFPNAGSVI